MGYFQLIAVLILIQEPEYPWHEDIHRFPSYSQCAAAKEFNRAYRSNIELKQSFYPSHYWYYQEIIGETDQLYACWDCLYDARGYCYNEQGEKVEISVCERRRHLKRLKELIGTEAYLAGRMPPCVPVWRFNNRGIR